MTELPTERATEQRRQRRAVAAIVAGVVTLGAVGIAASVLLTGGPCDDLLPAAFTAPPASTDGTEVIRTVAPDADGPALAELIVRAGRELGLGPVRGATPGGADSLSLPLEDGVFVVADDDHVRIVDTGLRAVATGRQRLAGVRLTPAGHEIGVVRSGAQGDDLVARYDGDLSLRACRPLDEPGQVLHVSAGVAVVGRDRGVEVVRLDGGTLWSGPGRLSSAATDAAVTGLLAIVATAEELTAFDLRSGEEAWRTAVSELPAPLTEAPLLLAGDDVVVVATESAVVRLGGDDGRVLAVDEVSEPPSHAIATRRDIAVIAGTEVLRIQDGTVVRAVLPSPAAGSPASRDAHVYVPTAAGAAAVAGDGSVSAVSDVPVGSIGVSDGYTIVGIDVGRGLLTFYGPAGPSS